MEQKVFKPVGKMYKKIAGKRYRLPRKIKKWYKKRWCKFMGFKTKDINYTFKLLNRDVDGNKRRIEETYS